MSMIVLTEIFDGMCYKPEEPEYDNQRRVGIWVGSILWVSESNPPGTGTWVYVRAPPTGLRLCESEKGGIERMIVEPECEGIQVRESFDRVMELIREVTP